METNTSDGVITGVFTQQDPAGEWHPVTFFSKTMNGPEQNYEIYNKELLTIICCLGEWCAELEGLQHSNWFDVYTDH